MSSTFHFVWDGNVLLHETFKKDNSENTELTTWVFEGFVPTAKLVNGKAYSIISDHLGTPILAIDSEGNEVWNRQLDIYGRVRKEYKHNSLGDDVQPFIPFLYQGQYYDFETKLAYNRFRYYSPESGTYISQDPIGLAGGNPTLYGYVKDNNWWVDVFGLDCNKKVLKDGAERAAEYSRYWSTANLKDTIKKFVGDNPTIEIRENGKRIYKDPENTSIQIVEDTKGNYFRIEDTNISGKNKYLDLEGNIPNNKTLENGKQTGRSKEEYRQVTHFNIE